MPTQANPTTPSPRTSNQDRRRLALALAACALAAIGAADNAAARPFAYTARALSGLATAQLHLLKPNGAELIEEGTVSGILKGRARAQLHTGARFTGTFTIRTADGSISGTGAAKPHGSGRYESFSGTFTTTSGTGRYAHIRGRAGLYGTFDRRTDAVIVQTQGTLTY